MAEEQATFQTMIGCAELVELAMGGLDQEDPLFPRVEEAVQLLLDDASCPIRALSHAELDILEATLRELREAGEAAFGEAMAVSLRRIQLEVDWTPQAVRPAAELLAGSGEIYLAARHAFGVIALAWQIQRHPADTLLTAAGLLRSVN